MLWVRVPPVLLTNLTNGELMEETIKPAKGAKGFLLYNPFTHRHFFRIYDPEDKRKFTDYRLSAEDIEVEILASGLELYEYKDEEEAEKKNRLDWSRKVLGRPETKRFRWKWCNLCLCPCIRCEECGNISCSGGGCDKCHDDFEEAIKMVNEGKAPTIKELEAQYGKDQEEKEDGTGTTH